MDNRIVQIFQSRCCLVCFGKLARNIFIGGGVPDCAGEDIDGVLANDPWGGIVECGMVVTWVIDDGLVIM